MVRVIAAFATIFAAATAISGVIAAAIAVYWFGHVDPKWRDTPFFAFEVELYGVLAVTLTGALVVSVAAYLFRKRLSLTRKSVGLCTICGIAYPLLLGFMEQRLEALLGIESVALPVAGWFYLIAFPVLGVVLITAPSQTNAHAA